ncbi:MAG: S1C family serine protease, partial [Acidimicrobiia bacterium]|nr:S1C family serine protease [Acidimicrobiia bacterium]
APAAPLSLLDPMLQPPAAERVDGVFGIDGPRLRRLGGFVALEEMVFTSASALDGRDRVALLAGGAWTEADVIGADPITDVAVLAIADGSIATTAPAPDEIGAVPIAPPVPGIRVALAMPGTIDPALATGAVIGADLRATTPTGSEVYGALRTSVGRRPGAPGSALRTEDTGGVVGFVIDSSGYLLSAIPIERVLEIGRAFLEWGLPAIEWLGIEATTADEGGVVVTDVVAGGPAMDAGAVTGDGILALDGVLVENLDHLVYLIRMAGVGTVVTLDLLRDGQQLTLEATIGSRSGS